MESINSSWLSIFINTVNWDNFINYNDKQNMTLKQLYMSYQYLSFKEDDSFVRNIVSSGMVDTKKLDKSIFDWTKDITEDTQKNNKTVLKEGAN